MLTKHIGLQLKSRNRSTDLTWITFTLRDKLDLLEDFLFLPFMKTILKENHKEQPSGLANWFEGSMPIYLVLLFGFYTGQCKCSEIFKSKHRVIALHLDVLVINIRCAKNKKKSDR